MWKRTDDTPRLIFHLTIHDWPCGDSYAGPVRYRDGVYGLWFATVPDPSTVHVSDSEDIYQPSSGEPSMDFVMDEKDKHLIWLPWLKAETSVHVSFLPDTFEGRVRRMDVEQR